MEELVGPAQTAVMANSRVVLTSDTFVNENDKKKKSRTELDKNDNDVG